MRLTYDQAQEELDRSADELDGLTGESDGLVDGAGGLVCEASISVDELDELSWRLRAISRLARLRAGLRKAAGGIDFDTVEAKVVLDQRGAPVDIALRNRTDATQLIEESMIAANEAVARFLRDAGMACIYRVHEKPTRESLEGLVPLLQEFGWFKQVDIDRFVAGNPWEVGKVLDLCEGRGEDVLVTTLVLRAMKRAVYKAQLEGHYALASEAYAHFTSPIRRYPDLVVHRMLKAVLMGRPGSIEPSMDSRAFLEYGAHR